MIKKILLALIRAYQYAISPLLGQNCRFYPSCSEYTRQALEEYGAVHGSYLGFRRICKCHPWHAGGIDLLPLKNDETRSHDGHSDSTPKDKVSSKQFSRV